MSLVLFGDAHVGKPHTNIKALGKLFDIHPLYMDEVSLTKSRWHGRQLNLLMGGIVPHHQCLVCDKILENIDLLEYAKAKGRFMVASLAHWCHEDFMTIKINDKFVVVWTRFEFENYFDRFKQHTFLKPIDPFGMTILYRNPMSAYYSQINAKAYPRMDFINAGIQ